ncbi:MAG: hypothetical protein LBR39_08205, partial [Coriobacteriales bacterium]|nr:hypothetical protein [Coriobacteriales bacterium]
MKRTQKLSAYRPVVAILLALNLALLLLLPAALWADEGATPGVVISPDESVVVNQPADEAAPLVEDAAPPAADETQPVEDIEADDSASPTEPGEVANLENVADVQSQTIEDNAIEATDAPTFTLTGPETITVGQPMELTLTISNPPEGTWSQVNGLILGVDFIFRSGF